ncbi:MAG: glycosyltransferase family 4 protein [bacterium]|nr:glycosyltransferase family 4 protein [bacterium]
MRIGIVTGEYPPMQGGVGDYTKILAHELVARGHEVFLFTSTQSAEANPALHITNVVKKWRWGTVRMIQKWAKSHKIDILSLQFETAAYGMSPFIHFLPQMIRVPVVTTFHDLMFPYLFPKAGALRPMIVRYLARTSAGVILTNHEDYLELDEHPRSTLIPLGNLVPADLPANFDRTIWRKQAGAGENDFLVAHFGFINHSKGVEILLEDLAYLRANGYPLKLVMIGGKTGSSDPTNAEYSQKIDALITQLHLDEAITWTGFVDSEQVNAYLEASDVVCLPFRDGASYRRSSLLAAIHQGCAIITTQPQVHIQLFKDGENMLLVSPFTLDPKAPNYFHISHKLLQLYRNQPLRAHIKEGALKLAEQFDWATLITDYEAFFAHVLEERK